MLNVYALLDPKRKLYLSLRYVIFKKSRNISCLYEHRFCPNYLWPVMVLFQNRAGYFMLCFILNNLVLQHRIFFYSFLNQDLIYSCYPSIYKWPIFIYFAYFQCNRFLNGDEYFNLLLGCIIHYMAENQSRSVCAVSKLNLVSNNKIRVRGKFLIWINLIWQL